MSRALALIAVLSLTATATAEDWVGKSVKLKEDVKLGRKLNGGLVRDGAALDKSKTYTVKSDDGTYLELVGETGFIFKSDSALSAEKPVKPDPIVGNFKWYTDAEFIFRANGTATATLDGKKWEVRWVANPYGGYVLMYDDGGVDVVKLSTDGKKLEGTGLSRGKSYPVSGTRQ